MVSRREWLETIESAAKQAGVLVLVIGRDAVRAHNPTSCELDVFAQDFGGLVTMVGVQMPAGALAELPELPELDEEGDHAGA